jgi:hypothetical protein
MSAQRDTHFANFAKLLWEELFGLYGYIDVVSFGADYNSDTERYEIDPEHEDHGPYIEIIARRAYDLMGHVVEHAPASVSDADNWNVPDMDELPEEAQ